MPAPPLVAVYWDDAHGKSPQWEDEIEPGNVKHGGMPIVTVGWIMLEDEAGITVACEQTSETTYRGSTMIPREYIRAIRPLRKGSLWNRPKPRAKEPRPTDS